MGLAISIFLGFRIKASYDRWWEARIIWGGIVNYSRSFGRQVLTLLDSDSDVKKSLIYRHISWVYILSENLRNQKFSEQSTQLLSEEDKKLISEIKNGPTQLLKKQACELRNEFDKNKMSDYRFVQIDSTLNEFYNLQGKSERIKNTPFPREIDFLAKVFVLIFTTLIPFHLVDELRLLTIPLTMIEGFIFTIIATIAAKYDNPFENKHRDTPMTAISRTIEIDLREMLGEVDLPLPKIPKNGFLY
jgi:putative membrane protein